MGSRARRSRPARRAGAAPVALALALAGCSWGGDGEGPARAPDAAGPRVVAGVELDPVPAGVVRACRRAQREARITILCPSRLPRPTRDFSGSSALPGPPLHARPWAFGDRPTGMDLSYSAESGRPWRDRPERFLHVQVVERSQRLPRSARPARLGGERGMLAPATGRGYAAEPYFANHVRFLWRERGVDYVASLHNFGPRTRLVLAAIVADLRPARELSPLRRPDPRRVRTIPVGVPGPVTVVAAREAVWVAGQGGRTVSRARLVRIDPATGHVAGEPVRIAHFGGPVGLAIGDGSLWVAQRGSDRRAALRRLDPGSGRLLDAIAAGPELSAVATGPGSVWAVDWQSFADPAGERGGAIVRIDPLRERVVARVRVGRAPAGIAVAAGSVWVTSNLDGTVSRIDARTGRVAGSVRVGAHPTGIAAGAGAVWVAVGGDGTVARIDPRTGDVVARISVGRGPRGVAVGGGSVWVTNELDDTVSRIDPERDRVVETITVGGGPAGIAAGAGAVWVANNHDRTVSRIAP